MHRAASSRARARVCVSIGLTERTDKGFAVCVCVCVCALPLQVCAICESNHYEANLARTQLKMGMDAERQALANLALNQLPDLKPGELYALVPR